MARAKRAAAVKSSAKSSKIAQDDENLLDVTKSTAIHSTPLGSNPKITPEAESALKNITRIVMARKSLAGALSRPSISCVPIKKTRAKKAVPKKAPTRSRAAKKAPKDEVEEETEDPDEDDNQDEDAPEEEVKVEKPKLKRAATTVTPKAKKAPTRRAPARGKKALAPPVLKADLEAEAEEDKPRDTDTEMVPELFFVGQMDLKKFQPTKVINESPHSKMITFLGTYNDEGAAIVRLEKSTFDEGAAKSALKNKETLASRDFANDVYSSYRITPIDVPLLNNIKATIVYPLNDKIIAKYSRSETILFSETQDVYMKVVEPYINSVLTSDPDYNKWVYNILDGNSEAERVLLNDPDPNSGFMMIPDLKWLGDEKDLYMLAICHRRDIRSLRDLDDNHLVLLKNILTKGTKAIKDKYKKLKGQLRTFIHYHPSFYHFHVHFRLIDPSDYPSNDRDHLLSTVINNITLNKDHYKKSAITYPLAQSSGLYQDLKKHKKI